MVDTYANRINISFTLDETDGFGILCGLIDGGLIVAYGRFCVWATASYWLRGHLDKALCGMTDGNLTMIVNTLVHRSRRWSF
jgi:hypothetical protein